MNAEQLCVILSAMTQAEREACRVVLAVDPEGNGFAPLHEAEPASGAQLEVSRTTNSERKLYQASPLLVLWPR